MTVHVHGDVIFADFAIETKSQKYNVNDQDFYDLNTRKLSWFRSQSAKISCAQMGIFGTPRKYHVRENVRSHSTLLEYSLCRYSNTAAFMVESVKKLSKDDVDLNQYRLLFIEINSMLKKQSIFFHSYLNMDIFFLILKWLVLLLYVEGYPSLNSHPRIRLFCKRALLNVAYTFGERALY